MLRYSVEREMLPGKLLRLHSPRSTFLFNLRRISIFIAFSLSIELSFVRRSHRFLYINSCLRKKIAVLPSKFGAKSRMERTSLRRSRLVILYFWGAAMSTYRTKIIHKRVLTQKYLALTQDRSQFQRGSPNSPPPRQNSSNAQIQTVPRSNPKPVRLFPGRDPDRD